MPTFKFEAMDATGQEIKDVIEAATEEEAQQTIRQMGYFVTKITANKAQSNGHGAGWQEEAPDGLRRGKHQTTYNVHPAAFDPSRRRPADLAQPADS